MLKKDIIKIDNSGDSVLNCTILRISNVVINPNGFNEITLQPIRPIDGFGRWIYCKYCYKNVKPGLSGIYQIVCPECGAGLTPDFFKLENLTRWFYGDSSAEDDDKESPEAKIWLEKIRAEDNKV